ncbi:MAG TPA: hypothetical protein VM240_08650 [Verrucomicrobiae bacterium]|nr:hypothetical protein [Verrucomicrobiae bacterium]
MPSNDLKLQTHLRAYQRLLAAESDRMRPMVHIGDAAQRRAVLNRLKALRLATRDLEKVIEKAEMAKGLQAPAPAPAPSAGLPLPA